MPNRKVRNTAILAKIESIYGTDPTPTGTSDALLISNQEVNPLDAQNVDRELVRNYLGASEQLVGTAFIRIGFTTELQGSGTPGEAPEWGKLLRGCAMAETITEDERVDYTPISSGEESLTIYYYDDGVLHKAHGCRGSFELDLSVSARPTLRFNFIGIDGGISATGLPTTTLTGWITPDVVRDAMTGDVTLGCSYADGELSGGTAYPSRGLTVSSGISVAHNPMLGGETVDIGDRAFVANVELDLTAAQEVTFMGTVKDNTTQGLGLVHGNAAGKIITVFAPAAQLINPAKRELNGKRLIGYEARLVPSSGNDEFRIVAA